MFENILSLIYKRDRTWYAVFICLGSFNLLVIFYKSMARKIFVCIW